MTDQLLRSHVAWCSGDRPAWIRAGPAVRDVRPATERVESRFWISGELAVEERLPANQHRVIQVSAGKQKQVLQVLRCQQAAPDAVLGIRNPGEHLRLPRGLDLRQRVAALAQR